MCMWWATPESIHPFCVCLSTKIQVEGQTGGLAFAWFTHSTFTENSCKILCSPPKSQQLHNYVHISPSKATPKNKVVTNLGLQDGGQIRRGGGSGVGVRLIVRGKLRQLETVVMIKVGDWREIPSSRSKRRQRILNVVKCWRTQHIIYVR